MGTFAHDLQLMSPLDERQGVYSLQQVSMTRNSQMLSTDVTCGRDGWPGWSRFLQAVLCCAAFLATMSKWCPLSLGFIDQRMTLKPLKHLTNPVFINVVTFHLLIQLFVYCVCLSPWNHLGLLKKQGFVFETLNLLAWD